MLRHAHSTANEKGVLAGRAPGIELSAKGVQQAEALSPFLSSLTIDHVISSPLTRCLSTIAPFLSLTSASQIGTPSFKGSFRIDDRLIEMDYGRWTGKKLSTLSRRQLWRTIQTNPSAVEFPGGESFLTMQNRVDDVIDEIANERIPRRKSKNYLIVTHGDICKYISTRLLGLPFNDFQRFHVDPASLSIFTLTESKCLVSKINYSLATQENLPTSKFALGGSNL